MYKQATSYEKTIFDIVKEHSSKFYYGAIFRVVDNEKYRVKVQKDKEEMVGLAFVNFPSGDRIDYEVKYNRITNLNENYTLIVPGIKNG